MKRLDANGPGDDLIELIGDTAEKIEKLAAIRNLMEEVDNVASMVAASWAPKAQPPQLLRMQVDRLLAKVSQTVPPHFHNNHRFLLPSQATALEAKRMLFNARMAVGVWMLAEWEKR